MNKVYLVSQLPTTSDYDLVFIATNLDNGDWLYLVQGDVAKFKSENPDFLDYYDGNWYQNVYPDAPGDTPLEKYLNAISGITMENPPNWTRLLPAIASNKQLFTKLMSTRNYNAFSTLQTVINFRDMDLFKYLTKAVIEGITEPLTEQEISSLNGILISNNFPSLAELTSA